MTLGEVKAATANLAFAEELADLDSAVEAGFYRALARAIWTTDALRPTRCVATFRHAAPYEGAKEVGAGDVLYDLRSLVPGIAALTEPPMLLREGHVIGMTSDYVLSGAHDLYLSRAFEGEVRLCCRMTPIIPDEDWEPDTVLSLDEELCQLLPLLTAHYLLMDDDAEKADRYLSLYREQYARLLSTEQRQNAVGYRSVNNW